MVPDLILQQPVPQKIGWMLHFVSPTVFHDQLVAHILCEYSTQARQTKYPK